MKILRCEGIYPTDLTRIRQKVKEGALVRLSNDRAITGFAHEYNRHGTTTLFVVLDVLCLSGKAA